LTHKPIILLVKIPRNEIIDEIDYFMDDHYLLLYDFYNIGGRSSGLFTYHLLDKTKKEMAYNEFNGKHAWYINRSITRNHRRRQFNTIFYKYFPDFKGIPPQWRDAEHGKIYEDDIIQLDRVLPLVYEWHQDPVKEAEEYFKKAKENKEDPGIHKLYRNYAYDYKNQEITRETNVYNITDENYTIPTETNGWWAVIIDIHY
jgi:hypothetical protein